MAGLKDARALVTGGAGFIGANLVRSLLGAGAEAHAVVSPSSDLWRLKDLGRDVPVRRVDLLDTGAIDRCVRSVRPDLIFHLAARGGHAAGRHDRAEALAASALATLNLLEATGAYGRGFLLHAASSLEYGPLDRAHRETDPLIPTTFRGAAKACASILCGQAAARGLPVAVLRLFSVYGPWEQPDRFIPTAVAAALEGRALPLTAGDSTHDFVFVGDVCEAFLLAAAARPAGETVNVAAGRRRTNREVVALIESLTGRRIRISRRPHPAHPSDTACWLADIRKARALLGWRPRHSLRAGLAETIRWQAARGGRGPLP